MVARDQRLMAALALLSSAVVLAACLLGVATEIAYAAPVLVLAVPLLAGRFVGEETISRATRALRRRPVRAPARAPVGRRRTAVVPPRGGRLIAAGLAVRPPPVTALS